MGAPFDDRDSAPDRSSPTAHPRLPTPQIVLVAVLIALPLAALVWVASYAKAEPTLWGFPFFYWYQLMWVFLAAICTTLAYRIMVSHDRRGRDKDGRR